MRKPLSGWMLGCAWLINCHTEVHPGSGKRERERASRATQGGTEYGTTRLPAEWMGLGFASCFGVRICGVPTLSHSLAAKLHDVENCTLLSVGWCLSLKLLHRMYVHRYRRSNRHVSLSPHFAVRRSQIAILYGVRHGYLVLNGVMGSASQATAMSTIIKNNIQPTGFCVSANTRNMSRTSPNRRENGDPHRLIGR